MAFILAIWWGFRVGRVERECYELVLLSWMRAWGTDGFLKLSVTRWDLDIRPPDNLG